jgi:beta-lactam-binding protein with PASTA domain/predicted Ser/Thr protein kinase
MPVSDTLINTLFDGRYRIVRKLGSGGMANVYLAEDEDLGRRVAIKILNERYANDDAFIERFRREAKSAASLSHPNIVSIYDRGEAEGTYYIAMEVIEGRSLKELILTRGPLPIVDALHYARQILQALRFAHRHGIIHRDIKPHNILIGEQGMKVTDFGIARYGPSQMTEAGSIMGTAQYLSPEQARGAPVTASSDLYSVGIVLHEMLTGRVPFNGDSAIEIAMKHLNDWPKPPSNMRPEIPDDIDHIVLRALAKAPEDRYQSAEEFIEDLERVEAGLPLSRETSEAATALIAVTPVGASTEVLSSDATRVTQPRPYSPARRPPTYPPTYPRYEEPPPKRRRIGPWLLVLALLAAAALAGWYVYTQIQDQLADSTVPVPLVEGLREENAKAIIEEAGLTPNVVEGPDADVQAGFVARQEPKQGTEVAEGSEVTLFVSTGPRKTIVPDVLGMRYDDAVKVLRDAGLDWRRRDVFSDKRPGRVVGQEPESGQEVVEGTTVLLRVSKGAQQVTVPDVIDQSEASARSELENAGFKVQAFTAPSDETPEGFVISQTPAPGEKATKGSTVQIVLSTGPDTVTVPNVEGQGEDSAREELEDAGFEVQVEEQSTDDPLQDGIVVDQDPEPETQAPPGSTVTITVGNFGG